MVANMSGRTARMSIMAGAVLAAVAAIGCGDVNAALEQLANARHVAAGLLVQFTKAADASNRAVMADTDEVSIAAAHEARDARQAVHREMDALGPMLTERRYTDEAQLLQRFGAQFRDYETLDDRVLDLTVENTNLTAQRLSFGAAQAAADEFCEVVDDAAGSTTGAELWHARALAAMAIANVREIQALQAPHIAEPTDSVMAQLENRMSRAEANVRTSLASLTSIAPPSGRAKLVRASAAFDKFLTTHAEILALSHRNTHVRSLALSLSEKPRIVRSCDELLHQLIESLDKRGFKPAR
jgi:hypothetical protein